MRKQPPQLLTYKLKVLVDNEDSKAIKVTEGIKDKAGKTITHWLPRSQISRDEIAGKPFWENITMPAWLAAKAGFEQDGEEADDDDSLRF